jgi:nicotinate-nucleotide adenylyltransferase
VGLFGGSFDPVHAGHLHAARAALAAFDLDRVVFVPAAQSPHKLGRRMAGGAERLAMLELAIRGEPRFSTSDLELRRGGASYTIDTVRELPSILGEAPDVDLYLIVGSDNLPGLSTWRSASELLRRVQPIVVHRDGEPEMLLDAIERAFGAELTAKVRAGYLRLPPVVASSTALRGALPALAADGFASGAAELDPLVHDYIRAHGLYGAQR